jgi:hypothetical protein
MHGRHGDAPQLPRVHLASAILPPRRSYLPYLDPFYLFNER